jgi:hypothetical protein
MSSTRHAYQLVDSLPPTYDSFRSEFTARVPYSVKHFGDPLNEVLNEDCDDAEHLKQLEDESETEWSVNLQEIQSDDEEFDESHAEDIVIIG